MTARQDWAATLSADEKTRQGVLNKAVSWCCVNGLMMVTPDGDYRVSYMNHTVYSPPPTDTTHRFGIDRRQHAPITLLPSAFPAKLFHSAIDLASPFNELYHRIANDPEWLQAHIAS